jgi:hypothetical protein
MNQVSIKELVSRAITAPEEEFDIAVGDLVTSLCNQLLEDEKVLYKQIENTKTSFIEFLSAVVSIIIRAIR